jgi:hypothetical protein
MTSETPPSEYFNGINFNPEFYIEPTSGITQSDADTRYLIKIKNDTATATLETFNGLKASTVTSSQYNPAGITDTVNVLNTSTGTINIGTSTSRSNTSFINIGGSVGVVNFGTTNGYVNIQDCSCNFNTYYGGEVKITTLNPISSTDSLYIGSSQTSNVGASINIGTSSSRWGPINIATNVVNAGDDQQINIGSANVATGNQTLKINRPITIGYTAVPQSFDQIGYCYTYECPDYFGLQTNVYQPLVSLPSLPLGTYAISYTITYTGSTTTNTNYTRQFHGISQSFSFAFFYPGLHQDIRGTYTKPSGVANTALETFTGICAISGTGHLATQPNFTGGAQMAKGGFTIVRIG